MGGAPAQSQGSYPSNANFGAALQGNPWAYLAARMTGVPMSFGGQPQNATQIPVRFSQPQSRNVQPQFQPMQRSQQPNTGMLGAQPPIRQSPINRGIPPIFYQFGSQLPLSRFG